MVDIEARGPFLFQREGKVYERRGLKEMSHPNTFNIDTTLVFMFTLRPNSSLDQYYLYLFTFTMPLAPQMLFSGMHVFMKNHGFSLIRSLPLRFLQ